jgi:hypothetical protein
MPALSGKSHSGNILPRFVLWLVPLAAGFYAVYLGQDTNWDLRNYHFYNPYAFLTGRMGFDVAVSHVATYYNPLMYLPFYFAVTSLPPRVVGFILGLLAGLNAFLLYAIARRAVGPERSFKNPWFCLATALLGILGAANLVEIGTSFGDNVLSLAVLAAAWLIVRMRHRLKDSGPVPYFIAAAAGGIAGAALGLKLPFAVYAVGLCAAFFGLALPWRRRLMLAFVFGIGVLGGTALTGGFWMLEMWRRFQNPLFPYFNQFFHSPWGAVGSYRDDRFIPKSPAMWLLFPFWLVADPMQVGEVGFRDLRFAVLYLLAIALLVKTVTRMAAGGRGAKATAGGAGVNDATDFLIVFMAVSFVLWMGLFSIYRYIIVCEFLAPLVVFLIIARLLPDPKRALKVTLAVFALLLVTLQPGNWGHRPWSEDYFGFDPPALAEPQNTLVLVTGHDPMAYMIPFFPPHVRFLRIQGFVTGPSDTPNETDRLMQNLISRHTGPMFVLFRSYEEWHAMNAVEFYGLQIDRSDCRTLSPGVEPQPEHPFYFCRLLKKTP